MKSLEQTASVVASSFFGALLGPPLLVLGYIGVTLARYSLAASPIEWGIPFFDVVARLLAELLYLSLIPVCFWGLVLGAVMGSGVGLLITRKLAAGS
jgi:hypothetical protein